MCTESAPSGCYSGTNSFPHVTTKFSLTEAVGGEGYDVFRVARLFLGYAKKFSDQNKGKKLAFEVERYLANPVEDPRNLKLNVLLWWKMNGSKYPILEKITRDILAVPVSAVASESTFSTRHRVIDDYRSSLTLAIVEALICTENWLQSKLFTNPVYNIYDEIEEQMFHMELQEEFKRAQASTMEIVSADIGDIDI